MPPKVMPTTGTVSRISSAVVLTTTPLAWRIDHRGMRYQTVSSMRRPTRAVLRTDHRSMRRPRRPNREGSTVTEMTAASTTAAIAP